MHYLYSCGNQESSTIDLASDCFRFVTRYFEVISASAPHIYHSALMLAPRKSIVRELYESHARPLSRVVHGLLESWGQHTAAITRPDRIDVVAWSPCNKFIAIIWGKAETIDVLDAVTLQKLQVLNPQPAPRYSKGQLLAFSPDSRILTSLGVRYLESWDLQTGQVGIIGWKDSYVGRASITYSANGKMIGAYFPYHNVILIFNIASGVHMHSYSTASSIEHAIDIWTHGESFRFTTVHTNTVAIWEVGFTSNARPTRVETLHVPSDLDEDEDVYAQLLPAPCRLALKLKRKVMVWDFQKSKYLLRCGDDWFTDRMSFSSDGRLFACSTDGLDIYLWKESPTGYTLHGILAHERGFGETLFSPNGEWIVAFGGSTMRLWRTNASTTPPSSYLTQSIQHVGDFVLDFSPDGMFAVVARKRDNVVKTVDLRSGVLQLTIDTGKEVRGVGVKGNNTIAVVDERKVVTWELPTGDRIPDAKATPEDSTRTTHLRGSGDPITWASISFGSSHVALAGAYYLYIHDASTGEQIFRGESLSSYPFFAPVGCNLLVDGRNTVSIGGGGQVQLGRFDVEAVGGYPWTSSRGYQITNDWWIVDRDGKRLLMLPSAWQSHGVDRWVQERLPYEVKLQVWNERFLALLHGELPEAVILELNQ